MARETNKRRRFVVARTFLVERQVTVTALDGAEALTMTKGYKYEDYDDTSDWNQTGEESVFMDYNSTLQSKLP